MKNTSSEKLTPRQLRFIAFLYLTVFAMFVGGVGFICWQHDAEQNTTLPKNNSVGSKKQRITMSTQIAQGASGQADFNYTDHVAGAAHRSGWMIDAPSGVYTDFTNTPDGGPVEHTVNNPLGFSVSPTGEVSVPQDGGLGSYIAYVFTPTGDGFNSSVYTFEVICIGLSVKSKFTKLEDGGWLLRFDAIVTGGTEPISYYWTNNYGAPSAGGNGFPFLEIEIGAGETGSIGASCNVADENGCGNYRAKTVYIPGTDPMDGGGLEVGWYCVDGVGCVYVDGTNEGDVTGLQAGPFETFAECTGGCGGEIQTYCPPGWELRVYPDGTPYCHWQSTTEPQPEGPAPEPSPTPPEELSGTSSGSGGSSGGAGSGESGSGPGSGSASGEASGLASGELSGEASGELSGELSGEASGEPSGELSGDVSGVPNPFDGVGYYCMMIGEDTSCEYIESSFQMATLVSLGTASVLSGPHVDCVPCFEEISGGVSGEPMSGEISGSVSGDVPGGDTSCPPATPSVPTAVKSCSAPSVTVGSGAFGLNTTSKELRRSSDGGTTWEVVHTFATAGTWVDEAVSSPHVYRYQLRACNGYGCSNWSASTVVNLHASIVPVWVSPGADSVITGRLTLVAMAGARSGLFATNPVSMRLFGGELEVEYHTSTNQWVATLDSALHYQGVVEVELSARDSTGCWSFPIPLSIDLNRSIERLTRWSEKAIAPALTAELAARGHQIGMVGYYPELSKTGPLSAQRYYRWRVVAPDPGAATNEMLGDNTAMENRVKSWQDIAPNTEVALNTPATSARLSMQSIPAEMVTLYNLEASKVVRVRQFEDEEIEIVTSSGYWKWSDEGLEELAKWSNFETPSATIEDNVRDAVRVGEKIYLCRETSPSRVLVLDLAAGKVASVHSPWGEDRAVRALERWNDKPFAIFGNNGSGGAPGSATAYIYESSVDDAFTVPLAVWKSFVVDGRLFLTAGNTYATANKLIEVGSNYSLTNIVLHDAPVSAVAVFEDETETTLLFGDTSDRVYRIEDETKVLIGSALGGDISAISRFKGSANIPRFAVGMSNGANASKLFLREGSVFLPDRTIENLTGDDATAVVGLHRVLATLRDAEGNPLMGGDAGLFSESLAVTFNTADAAYLMRVQEADVDPNKTTRARAIKRQNFKAVKFQTAPVEA